MSKEHKLQLTIEASGKKFITTMDDETLTDFCDDLAGDHPGESIFSSAMRLGYKNALLKGNVISVNAIAYNLVTA